MRHLDMKLVMDISLRLLLALVVVLLLWDMRFRFDHIIVDNETYLVRVHRVTGDADILIPGEGWVPAEDAWSDSTEAPPTSANFRGPSFAPLGPRWEGARRVAAPAGAGRITGVRFGHSLCRLAAR